MADDRTDPLADLFALVATPLSGAVRSIEQFRKGVDEFLKGVENFNRTMENLNETTERINVLLAEVEEPIRAAIPQVTRTVKAADQVMQVVSGPAMAVAPGLSQLADTLSTPAFSQLPGQMAQFTEVLGEVSRRLAPLTVFAESAGGLFGGFRVPGTRSAPPPPPEPAPPARSLVTTHRTEAQPAHEEPVTKRTARKQPAKKTTKQTTRKQTAKKQTTRKQTAKKQTGRSRNAPARKSTATGRKPASRASDRVSD